MNSEKLNVFALHKQQQCKEHKQKLSLVCVDQNCLKSGLMCIDCLINNHQGCKANIIKKEDYFQMIFKELQVKQGEKQKKFSEAQIYLGHLSTISVQFNKLIIQEKQELEAFLQDISNEDNEENQLRELFRGSKEEQDQVIKAQIQNKKQNIFQPNKKKFRKNELDEIIKTITSLVEKNKRNIDPKLKQADCSKTVKVKSIDNLQSTDNSVIKLRIDLEGKNWDGIENILCKFVNLQSLFINAMESSYTVIDLKYFINAIQSLPSLQKFDINLVSTQADDSTLCLIFSLLETKKVQECCILIGYSRIFPENFIRQLQLHRQGLLGMKKLIVSNQLKEFTEAQIQQLKSCFERIEILE